MRILLIDQFGEPGGAQLCLMEAALGFAARGWELHAALPAGPMVDRVTPFCKSITPLACGPFNPVRKSVWDAVRFGFQLPQLAAAIGRVTEREKIDVLYVNGPRMVPAAV